MTAPLRRLVDRYGLEVCVALCAGAEVPGWVAGGAARPARHDAASRVDKAHAYENAVLDLVEATTLQGRIGEKFTGVVVSAEHDDPHRGEVVVGDPAVEARVTGAAPLPVGEEVELVLAEADPRSRVVRFTL